MAIPPVVPVTTSGGLSYAPSLAAPPFRVRPPSAGTAETLVLVALIFQILGTAFTLFVGLLFLPVLLISPFPGTPVIAAVFAAIAGIGILLLVLGYAYSYRRIQAADYAGARTPTMVLGIVTLFIGVIPGILYLIAYSKLGDALHEMAWPQMGPFPGYGGGTSFAPVANPMAHPMCPRCGMAATYIAPYNRYYCYSCRTYL
jgi:hypothetical protein